MDDADDASVPFGAGWRLWEQFALRGPGFPAAGVLRLAPDGLAAAADKFGADEKPAGAGWDAFAEEFADAAVATARELQGIAASGPFQAAVAWQNRMVLRTGVEPFLAWTPTAAGRTSMPRQREELVAHYWQRFCVKNDTIGFFGPVGWGRWDAGARGVEVDPGRGLVEESTVYFSSWAVDTLAATIAADPELGEWTSPRRVPFLRVDADGATVPGRPPQRLTPEQRRVLELCDGTRPAREIARRLPGIDVPAVLDDLAGRRWVVRRLEIPAGARPEVGLRRVLERVGDAGPRDRALALLDSLEAHRDRIGAATGPQELSAAMAALETEFAALTESAAVREKSATTAPCRALVYSDCRRSARARLGGGVLDALAPLEPLLTSARWLTDALARRVAARVAPVFARLREQGPVDLAAFWFACMPVLHGAAVADAAEVQREFQDRWAAVLRPGGARRVRLAGAEVAEGVRAAFGDPRPGWTAARYLSPDVLIAADDADAVERGEFDLVLGELHVATNTLGASLFVHQHPDPGELLDRTGRDHPGPRLLPVLAKEHRARLSTRVRQCLVRPEDYYVALVDFTVDPHRPRTVMSADVAVEERGGELVAVLPDGAEFPVLDVFSHVLTTLVMDLFRLLPDADHSPRVTIDRMVVARESWRFVADSLEFTGEKDEARRFVRARRWRDEHELPRFVFVVSSTEPRPFYVDFDSPVYVNIFAKAARRLARKDPDERLVITEMLPTPERAWLTDDEGNRYTSELRFVAVDQTAVDQPVAHQGTVGDQDR